MLRPSRDNHQIPRLNILILPINRSFPFSGSKGEGLVHGVYFVADVAADGDGHEDYLRVEACEEDFAEFGGGGGEGGGHAGEVDHFVGWWAGVGFVGCHCADYWSFG